MVRSFPKPLYGRRRIDRIPPQIQGHVIEISSQSGSDVLALLDDGSVISCGETSNGYPVPPGLNLF